VVETLLSNRKEWFSLSFGASLRERLSPCLCVCPSSYIKSSPKREEHSTTTTTTTTTITIKTGSILAVATAAVRTQQNRDVRLYTALMEDEEE